MHIHKANKQHQNLVVNRRVGTAIGKSIATTAIAILAKIDSRYRYRYFLERR